MRKFKTESKKLLDLMINSIYTNREIFLRELISNASDAVDKLYFKSLTDEGAQVEKDDLSIHVSFDKDARVIVVSDNGIGMSKEDLDKNLGTIAHSDSQAFKQENAESQGGDVDIIGQFGVGFYSSFMVAKNVRVVSRKYGEEEAWAWESDGIEGYTIEESLRLSHGTDVILTLKDDAEDETYSDFLNEHTLEQLIRRYSNYVRYPIKMTVTRSREVERPEDAGEDYKPQFETIKVEEVINSMVPIWKRNKSDVSEDEYDNFYCTNFHDYEAPLRTTSIHAEGSLNYDALLFIPAHAPSEMYSRAYEKGLSLYSSNVLIMDKCPDLVPDCFNFVRGIVGSQDLTLNISRETLQHNSQLRAIARKVEKKIKQELATMLENDRESYEQFFGEFGRSLKWGLYGAYGEKNELLADLLLFYSAKYDKMVTLDEYVDMMPEGQEAIFFYNGVGEQQERLAQMPVVSSVVKRGYDVLLCTDPSDEFCLQMIQNYKEKEFKNVAGGDLGLESEEEKAAAEAAEKDNAELFEAMQKVLDGKVSKIVASTRLSDAPACLTAEGPISIGMERVMRGSFDGSIVATRVLEVNVAHPVFEALAAAQDLGQADKVATYAKLLYNQALLIEGEPVDDVVEFTQAIASLMV